MESAQIPKFLRLFRAAFGPDTPPEFLTPAFLDWKLFHDRPEWHGSRSYVIQQKGSIAAHACVWPIAFHTPAGTVSCCHFLDWIANPEVAGAGTALYQELSDRWGTSIAIGGTPQARRLLPKLGYRPYGVMRYFSRVIHAFDQFRARPKASVGREILRLVRNTAWALPPVKKADPGWVAIREQRAGAWLDELFSDLHFDAFSPGARSSALANYLLDCPAARCSLYSITRDGELCGYFLLNEVHGQTRVIDLFVRSTESAVWGAAWRLALHQASCLPGTCEVVTASSLPWLDQVLRRLGMRERDARPILLCDRRGILAAAPPLHIQMIDSDAFFLYSHSYPFLT